MIILCWFEDSIRLNVHFVFIDFFYWWSIYSRIFVFLSGISFLLEDFLMHSSLVLLLVKVKPQKTIFFFGVFLKFGSQSEAVSLAVSLKTARYCTHYIATLFHFQRGRLDVQTISPESLTDSTSGTCFSVFRPLNRWQFGRGERDLRVEVTHTQPPLHARTHTLIKGRWCKLQWTYPCLSAFLCLRQWHVFILTQWRSEQRTDNIEPQMMNVFMHSGNLWLNPLSLSHRHTHTRARTNTLTERTDSNGALSTFAIVLNVSVCLSWSDRKALHLC